VGGGADPGGYIKFKVDFKTMSQKDVIKYNCNVTLVAIALIYIQIQTTRPVTLSLFKTKGIIFLFDFI
jgi:hypothetical protein